MALRTESDALNLMHLVKIIISIFIPLKVITDL